MTSHSLIPTGCVHAARLQLKPVPGPLRGRVARELRATSPTRWPRGPWRRGPGRRLGRRPARMDGSAGGARFCGMRWHSKIGGLARSIRRSRSGGQRPMGRPHPAVQSLRVRVSFVEPVGAGDVGPHAGASAGPLGRLGVGCSERGLGRPASGLINQLVAGVMKGLPPAPSAPPRPGPSAPAGPEQTGWRAKRPVLSTPWTAQVSPSNEDRSHRNTGDHPDRRENLNGGWQFAPSQAGAPLPPVGLPPPRRILVPFPMESALSGIGAHYQYSRTAGMFTTRRRAGGQSSVVVNFGAVAWGRRRSG